MCLVSPRRLHGLLTAPLLLPLLFFGGSSSPNDPPALIEASYETHGTLFGSFPFSQPIRVVSTGPVSQGELRVFGSFNGFSQPITIPDEEQQSRNALFHAFGTPQQNSLRAAELLSQATRGTGNLWAFGTYLHFLQDSFSHKVFARNVGWGQSRRGHWPDQTNDDPGKAVDMAHATYEKLQQFGDLRGCHCHGDVDWKKVQDFIDVGFGKWNPISFIRETSDAQLRQKIGILGVPWRSPTGR